MTMKARLEAVPFSLVTKRTYCANLQRYLWTPVAGSSLDLGGCRTGMTEPVVQAEKVRVPPLRPRQRVGNCPLRRVPVRGVGSLQFTPTPVFLALDCCGTTDFEVIRYGNFLRSSA